MADTPTTEQIERQILNYAARDVRRPGEIFNMVMAQINLKLPADEFEVAVRSLASKGYVENAHGPFLKITEAGFAAM